MGAAPGVVLTVLMLPSGRASTAPSVPGTSFQYDPTWPKPLPKNSVLGPVAGVFVDAQSHIWIVHRPGTLADDEEFATTDPLAAECCVPPILEFDQAGNVLQAWVRPNARLRVADARARRIPRRTRQRLDRGRESKERADSEVSPERVRSSYRSGT
jgi:hypothetical protein